MAEFHIWVASSLFRSSVGTFSKKHTFVGKLKQLWFSVGNTEAKPLKQKHLFVGNSVTFNKNNFLWVTLKQSDFLWVTGLLITELTCVRSCGSWRASCVVTKLP